MGGGCRYKCLKCGYSFTAMNGFGFSFPVIYEETVQKAKAGELGETIKTFFDEHTNGAINAENVTLCCNECGNLAQGKDLTMYIPNDENYKDIEHGRWTVGMPFEEASYVTNWDLEEHYKEYAKYQHKCAECGGDMHIVSDEEELMCPKCKLPFDKADRLFWD
ncbi:hypothetical protein [Butyrivibrio sp. XPD2006]|uniref:hypothetical protein n=1 Tax=Butyrivibrio sp. XPD2006 TaxID=1280668 RepID=UPI0003B415B7|nr:hypothetical protein [Butyrivibrio sp. XPD2006]